MSYNNLISRTDAAALIPENVSQIMLTNLQNESAALSLFQRVPMSTAQTRMPVISALPTAYFVNGDTGLKQTTEANWANKYLNVEELAAIVPIPEAVLADTQYDVWGAIRPLLEQAIGRALDAAIFFAVNKPASWPADIAAAASAAGNTYNRGTNNAAAGGIAEDINQTMALLEADGYAVNGFVTRTTYKARLRGARATDGQKLMDLGNNTIEGSPVRYVMPGLWPTGSGSAELFAGDWTQQILGVRQDFTYKMLTEAALFDNAGTLIYNLPQQDMVAMRIVFRVAWQTANPINYEQGTEASRYPVAVLRAP